MANITINDEKVITYLEDNGKLFKKGTWDIYSARYWDRELADHINADANCKGVVRGEHISLEEERNGEFLDTFHGCENKLLLTAQGYGCDCGHFPAGTLGYYIEGTFSDILLDLIGIHVDVNIIEC